MKQRIFLIVAAVFLQGLLTVSAQLSDPVWKEIDRLDSLGQTATALEKLKEVHKAAVASGNTYNRYRSLLGIMSKNEYVAEESELENFALLDAECHTAPFPLNRIFFSLKGDYLWNYYQENRYRYYYRSEEEEGDTSNASDYRFWSLERILSESAGAFDTSLLERGALKNIPVSRYAELLQGDSTLRERRNTLFDVLAHTAVQFYLNTESGVTAPGEVFSWNKPEFYLPAREFMLKTFTTSFPEDHSYKAYLLFRELTALHLDDPKTGAVAALDILRLKEAHSTSQQQGADSVLYHGFLALDQRYKDTDAEADVKVEIMYIYRDDYAFTSDRKGLNNAYSLALELAEEIISRFPGTEAAERAKETRHIILRPSISLQSKEILYPGENFLVRTYYQNMDSVVFRLKPWSEALINRLNMLEETELIRCIDSIPNLKIWPRGLATYTDHRSHSTDMAFEGISTGKYILTATGALEGYEGVTSGAFIVLEVNSIEVNILEVSGEKGQLHVIVTDRKTGTPLKGATVKVYSQEYNYDTYEYSSVFEKKLTTNALGLASFVPEGYDYYDQYLIEASYKGNELEREVYYYNYYSDSYTVDDEELRIFTDRNIYRPGQVIHFKAIFIRNSETTASVIPGETIPMSLTDAFGNTVWESSFTTNEFGSISGSVTLPSNVITGYWRLENAYLGSAYIRVEEYKRPKFEVTLEKPDSAYAVGDMVSIKGTAEALGGFGIDGATVSYTVTRTAIPYWGFYEKYIYPPYYQSSEQILSGEMVTGTGGTFEISFTALPDPEMGKESGAQFTYSVSVSVTDLNGETRSASEYISVGYRSLEVYLDAPSTILTSSDQKITASITNLNGKPYKTSYTIRIYKNTFPAAPKGLYFTTAPDTLLYTPEEFRKLFPGYAVSAEETEVGKGPVIAEIRLNSADKTELNLLDLRLQESGTYTLELEVNDPAFGPLKHVSVMEVLNFNGQTAGSAEKLYMQAEKEGYQPGEEARLLVGSSMENAQVFVVMEAPGTDPSMRWLKLDRKQQVLSFPVNESWIGNAFVYAMTVKDGRTYFDELTLYVPDSTHTLSTELVTYRDNMLPGSQEKWALKVTGKGKEVFASEVLACMYDASLDALGYGNYFYLDYTRYNSGSLSWRTNTYYYYNYSYSREFLVGYTAGYYFRYGGYEWFNTFGYMPVHIPYSLSFGAKVSFKNKDSYDDKTGWDYGDGFINNSITGGTIVSEQKEGEVDEVSNLEEVDISANRKDDEGKDAPPQGSRKNFSETAFFFPDLKTDAEGNVLFEFTMPESITRWKFMALAHTKDLKTGSVIKEMTTSKKLMVNSFAPRFFREGDQLSYTAKITNLTDSLLSGQARMNLTDAISGKTIAFSGDAVQSFSAKPGESILVEWSINIPEGIQAITCDVSARAAAHTDGESMTIPVLSSRMLVKESLPLFADGKGTYTYTLKNLANAGKSTTLEHEGLTVEFTSNPVWYAIQSIPYLAEFPHECAEQIFARYFANSAAAKILEDYPKIKEVFGVWSNYQPDAFLSELEKNQELKSLVLEETPWLLDATSDQEKKRRLAALFGMSNLSSGAGTAYQKLLQKQNSDGSFSWFQGGPSNRYITQYIVAGMGKMLKMGLAGSYEVSSISETGLTYIQARAEESYQLYRKDTVYRDLPLSSLEIQGLYAQSFFTEDLDAQMQHRNFFLGIARKTWLKNNMMEKALLAFIFQRFGDEEMAQTILRSIKENAVQSKEKGVYWKQNPGWNWVEAPIETHTAIMEAVAEITPEDKEILSGMETWLILNKQTNDWGSTISTTQAIWSLLKNGNTDLSGGNEVVINLGSQQVSPSGSGTLEAGTGYFIQQITPSDISPEMAKVTVTKSTDGLGFGAVYWQYFEDIDKVPSATTQLQIRKQLFIELGSESGPGLAEITPETQLKVGDRVIIRMEVETDRAMEFVHIKDMRASTFEPENVNSGYRYRDGLSYYESTRDAATHFFVDYLPRGSYVLEYAVRVTHAGSFTNGIASIECMYAPAFGSHTAGQKVSVTPW